MSLDTEFGDMAQEMIAESGTTVTITVPGGGYNPATRDTTGTPRTITATAAVVDSKSRFLVGDEEVQATKKVLIAPQGLPADYTPARGHKVTIGPATFTVVGLDATQAQHAVVLHTLYLAA